MRTGVVTIVAGRHDHLARQYDGLRAGLDQPDHHIIVAMGDPDVAAVRGRLPGATVLTLPAVGIGLPLGAARNAGAAAALAGGAELLVFLDVDCIPGPGLVRRYAEAAAQPKHRDHLLSGSVHYLPVPASGGYDLATLADLTDAHSGRPAPRADEILIEGDHRLFWSLSFAVTAPVWNRIGGFCEDYTGYGGEDTDFAELAAAAGVGLRWVGGATAYHQYHPVSTPPVEHVDDVLRNGALFHRRWGWWPMRGWLDAFAERGLIRHDAGTDSWVTIGHS
ncbi:MAG: galactosyltransferase-related protein [Geodermatophilaceae bacterium]